MALRWSALEMWCFYYRHIAPLEQSGQQNIHTSYVMTGSSTGSGVLRCDLQNLFLYTSAYAEPR